MAELKQHAWLLSIIGLLLMAKFIVVPIFTWQDTIIAEITLLNKQQHKINSVLEQSSGNGQLLEQVNRVLTQAEPLFTPFKDEASFKLEQQQMIEALLVKYQLRSQNIGWEASKSFDEISVIRYPITLVLSGNSTDIIEFLAALESMSQLIEIASMNVSLKGQRDKKLGQITNGNLTLYLFADQQGREVKQEGDI